MSNRLGKNKSLIITRIDKLILKKMFFGKINFSIKTFYKSDFDY